MDAPLAPLAHLAHLDLRGIEQAEQKARPAHPILFRVAELVVFVRDPVRWIQAWRSQAMIGCDGKPRP